MAKRLDLNPRSLIKTPRIETNREKRRSAFGYEIDEKRRKETERKQKCKAKADASQNDGSDTKETGCTVLSAVGG